MKVRAILREDDTATLISNVPPNLSTAEHRLRVLQNLTAEILEDQETISGTTVEHMCRRVMRYMHRSIALIDIVCD